MGIASGVFWIVFGLCYIWYRALKDNPQQTIQHTLAGILCVGAVVGFCFTFHWLLSISIPVAMVFGIVAISAVVFYAIKCKVEQDAKCDQAISEYNRVMRIVNSETYTDQEIMDYAKVWAAKPEGWRYHVYGFEACKDQIIDDYRKYVRYVKVSQELREQEGS